LPPTAGLTQINRMTDPRSSPPLPSATIPLDQILHAIADRTRWYILRELAGGEALMVTEIAERIGQSPNVTSKHIGILRKAGIALQSRNRLYTIAPQFLTDKTHRVLEFGYCLLRMNVHS
jgi:DNA-binding transcriptional ArsR family regulator